MIAVGDSMFSRLVPRDAELVAKLALCSDLNVREQGDIRQLAIRKKLTAFTF